MSVIPATLVRYRHGRYSRNDAGPRSGCHPDSVSRQRISRCEGHLPRGRRLQRRQGAHRDLHRHHRRPPVVRFQAHFARHFRRFSRPLCCCFCIPPTASPTAISISPPIATTCWITTSTTAIQRRDSISQPLPRRQADHVDLTFIVTPGRPGLRARRGGGRTQANAAGPGDGPHQSARRRSASRKAKLTASQRRLYDLGIFSRVDAAIQNPEGDEPTKYVLYLHRRSRPLFDEHRRRRGNWAHRRRHRPRSIRRPASPASARASRSASAA